MFRGPLGCFEQCPVLRCDLSASTCGLCLLDFINRRCEVAPAMLNLVRSSFILGKEEGCWGDGGSVMV